MEKALRAKAGQRLSVNLIVCDIAVDWCLPYLELALVQSCNLGLLITRKIFF